MSKMISLIIPVYNTEKSLNRCLDSIQSQDYDNYEAILINDGSTDNSLGICNQYAKNDKRFTVFSKKNAGVSEARNTGLSIAKGEYVQFIDSDDFILPGMFSTMVNQLEKTRSDICVCQFAYGDFEGTNYKTVQPEYLPLGLMNSIEFERIMTNRTNGYYDGIVCSPWNKLYKRELFNNIRFVGDIGEDYEKNDLINSYNRQVVIIPDTFYIYCNNPNSLTNIPFNKKRLHFLEVLIERVNLYNDQEIVNDAKKIYCELYIEYYYKSKVFNISFNNPKYKAVFHRYVSDLRKTGLFSKKFFVRMCLFNISPYIYKKFVLRNTI